MPKQTQPLEMTKFVQGLLTEASPLEFPPNASRDEVNFELDKTGKRVRRLGMDFEANYNTNFSGHTYDERGNLAINTYLWENVGEDASVSLACVQVGSIVYFHSRENEILSTDIVGKVDLQIGRTKDFDFTTVDGDLIIATGGRILYRVQYNGVNDVELTEFTLKVRDQWGVPDVVSGFDLTEADGISRRPTSITANHTYNLRNQGWGVPRPIAQPGGSVLDDPMTAVYHWEYGGVKYGKWPSNADLRHEWERPNPEEDDQAVEFFVEDMHENPPHAIPAAKGYFIIDAIHRGASRAAQYNANMGKYPELDLDLTSALDEDRTLGGASYVAEYAGRVFYSGFGGGVVGESDTTPQLSSYVMYSRLVQKPSDIHKCYQEGDPSDPDTSDLVDTDGGLIRISGMGEVVSMIAVGRGLFVIANNGVWLISGGSDQGFTANSLEVTKVSDIAPSAKHSIVEVEGTFMFWADDGIYHVVPDKLGTWQTQNLTQNTIQTYYLSLEANAKLGVKSYYDRYRRQVRWLFSTERANNQDIMRELILDMAVGAWYPFEINNPTEGDVPVVRDYMEARPFTREVQETKIIVADEVTVNGDQVIIGEEVQTVTQDIPTLKFLTTWWPDPITDASFMYHSFAEYNNTGWLDWGVTDAAAYMETGSLTAGDSAKDKMVPYLTFHMEKGFTGFDPTPPECAPYDCGALESWWTNPPDTTATFPLIPDANVVPPPPGGGPWTKYGSAEVYDMYNGWQLSTNWDNGFGGVGRIAFTPDSDDTHPDFCDVEQGGVETNYYPWLKDPHPQIGGGSNSFDTTHDTFGTYIPTSIQACVIKGPGTTFRLGHHGLSYGYITENQNDGNGGIEVEYDIRRNVNVDGTLYDTIEINNGGVNGPVAYYPENTFDNWCLIEIGNRVNNLYYRVGETQGYFKTRWELVIDETFWVKLSVAGSGTTDVQTFNWNTRKVGDTFNDVNDPAVDLNPDHRIWFLGAGTAWGIGGECGGLYGIALDFPNLDAAAQPGDKLKFDVGYGPTSVDFEEYHAAFHRNFDTWEAPGYCPPPGQQIPTDAPSSCLVTTKWDETFETSTGRWSSPFQVYREIRQQDKVGYGVVTTRNKVRGRGAFYRMKMETEPAKDCRILGWNLNVAGNQHV